MAGLMVLIFVAVTALTRSVGIGIIALATIFATTMALAYAAAPYWVEFRPVHDYPACPKCTYNLTGNTTGQCPECGWPFPPNDPVKPRG